MPLATGTLLGRFAILRPLGAGGLGEVYAALDGETGQEVALKLLHEHLAREPQLVERFKRELSVTRSLSHPGIVRAFDLHQDQGRPFLSMELLRGETLAQRLGRGPVSRTEALRIVRELCSALEAAHAAGVVHRDLKPQNVFLCEGGNVKILDFGLARVAGWARLTAQSTVMGTPGYLAPELLAGQGADARADLYAVGAIAFELLTGKRAFEGSDPYAVMRRQRDGARIPDDLPDAAWLRRALEADPEKRFFDAGQMIRALDGAPAPAPPAAAPALVRGDLDVVLHYEPFRGKAVREGLRAAGIELSRFARARLAVTGKMVLAQGVARESAEALAAICREHGLAVSTAPARKRRGAALHAFARRAVWRVFPAALPLWPVWVVYRIVRLHQYMAEHGHLAFFTPRWVFFVTVFDSLDLLVRLVPWVALASLVSALTAMFTAPPPIRDVPEGDAALRRLIDGIARRMSLLRARFAEAPPASKMLLEQTLESATHLETQAQALAERAAQIGDPLAGAEAPTLPPGLTAERDAALTRLLSIASALDDALAPGSGGSGDTIRIPPGERERAPR